MRSLEDRACFCEGEGMSPLARSSAIICLMVNQ